MSLTIRRAVYYYTTVTDKPGEAFRLLSYLAASEVSLLAFNAVPMGSTHTELVLFPENESALMDAAQRTGLALAGPHHALLVQGDDELGALVEIHGTLYDAGVNVYASHGVTDGKGCFGYLIFIRPDDIETACRALDAEA